MSPEILTAIVAAVTSLIVSLISLFTSRDAQRTAIKAAESSKRTEQVRLKATESGEKLLTSLADIIIPAETILQILDFSPEKSLPKEEAITQFGAISRAASVMRKLLYSSAIYTTPEIRINIEKTLESATRSGVDLSQWKQVVDDLRENHKQIARLFHDTYLVGDT